MRCVCCNALLPAATIYRTVLVPHPTIEGQTTTMKVEEDFCAKCAQYTANTTFEEDTTPLEELGITSPEYHNYYD